MFLFVVFIIKSFNGIPLQLFMRLYFYVFKLATTARMLGIDWLMNFCKPTNKWFESGLLEASLSLENKAVTVELRKSCKKKRVTHKRATLFSFLLFPNLVR